MEYSMFSDETMDNHAAQLPEAEMLPQLALMPIGVDYSQGPWLGSAGRQDEGLPFNRMSVHLMDDEDSDEEDKSDD